MARIHELLEEVKDPSLRRRLSEEVANLTRNKKFGLVFEDHEVERTLLYGVNIRAGMPAVKKAGKINEVWDVLKVEDGQAMCRRSTTGEIATIAQTNLSLWLSLVILFFRHYSRLITSKMHLTADCGTL